MAGPLAQFYEERISLAALLTAVSAQVREVRELGKGIVPAPSGVVPPMDA